MNSINFLVIGKISKIKSNNYTIIKTKKIIKKKQKKNKKTSSKKVFILRKEKQKIKSLGGPPSQFSYNESECSIHYITSSVTNQNSYTLSYNDNQMK